ncbi:MAG: hypothetical protein H7A16_09670 [Sinobacteraceae bacterium]|nr:hypothetical protein [Nevskiaceae bacterium]
MNRFDDVMAGEKVPLAFDFSEDLPSGVTLALADSVSIAVVRGTDADPDAMKVGAAAVVGSDVIQMVNPTVSGVEYRVTGWGVFSDGQRRAIPARMTVVSET